MTFSCLKGGKGCIPYHMYLFLRIPFPPQNPSCSCFGSTQKSLAPFQNKTDDFEGRTGKENGCCLKMERHSFIEIDLKQYSTNWTNIFSNCHHLQQKHFFFAYLRTQQILQATLHLILSGQLDEIFYSIIQAALCGGDFQVGCHDQTLQRSVEGSGRHPI